MSTKARLNCPYCNLGLTQMWVVFERVGESCDMKCSLCGHAYPLDELMWESGYDEDVVNAAREHRLYWEGTNEMD